MAERLLMRFCTRKLTELMEVIKQDEDKLKAVRSIGFGGLLDIDLPKYDTRYIARLLDSFNLSSFSIDLASGAKLKIREKDVFLVYSFRRGVKKVVHGRKSGDESLKVIQSRWCFYHGDEEAHPTFDKVITDLKDYPVSPDQRRTVPEITNFSFNGPVPFLMLVYFDRVQKGYLKHQRVFPIISSWNVESVRKRLKMEKSKRKGREFDLVGEGSLLKRIKLLHCK